MDDTDVPRHEAHKIIIGQFGKVFKLQLPIPGHKVPSSGRLSYGCFDIRQGAGAFFIWVGMPTQR